MVSLVCHWYVFVITLMVSLVSLPSLTTCYVYETFDNHRAARRHQPPPLTKGVVHGWGILLDNWFQFLQFSQLLTLKANNHIHATLFAFYL